MPNRYVIALVASCVVAAAGLGFSWYLHKSVTDKIRQGLREAAANGTLPEELKDFDIENPSLEGLEVRVTSGDMTRIQIANALSSLWFVWIPAIFAVAFLGAYVTAPKTRDANVQNQKS